ncbi:MAG TPA: beta-ketoacyl-[acyl-carrier-protein] synthase family protein, partial [Pseudobdellovibrionaceae bacterium]|nr:beta-ketoacyl-[acyl-carrier-protein] synthase family protein [Pseudobdellovibrionaceae bacterium]
SRMTTTQIPGLGAVCANGLSKETIFESCLQGRSSVGPDGLASLSPADWEQLQKTTPEPFNASRAGQLSFQAAQEALKESRWTPADLRDAGFILASTTSQIDQWERDLPFYRKPEATPSRIQRAISNQSLGTPLLSLARHFGVQGPVAHLASSCSASLQALAMATLWIRSGKVERCLVGGVEIQSDLTRTGFQSLRLLTKGFASPFDKRRAGINLGEGGAFLCLETKGLSRGAPVWGEIIGVGLSSDAYHATAPHPEGRGSLQAMRMALEMSGRSAPDVDWIYAHGTGSPANDTTEAKAIHALFPHRPPVTSTKSSHGHTLAACGVLESVLGLMAMGNGKTLPTFNY